MSNKEPVITGVGLITGLGSGTEVSWNSLLKGKSCIRHMPELTFPGHPARLGGPLAEDFVSTCKEHLDKRRMRQTADFVWLGMLGARLAAKDAGLDLGGAERERTGAVVGNCVGGLRYFETVMAGKKADQNIDDVLVFESTIAAKFMQNALSANIALDLGLTGPNLVVSTACSSGNYALAIASEWIRQGKCDVVIAGGAEIFVCNFAGSSFANLGACTSYSGDPGKAVRPFDRDRSGTVVSDGAALLVLESREHAQQRQAQVYCSIAGAAMTCEAYDIVLPEPDGRGMAMTMDLAIRNSGVEPARINHIQAHGTATVSNDLAETKAIKKVFGRHAYDIPITAIKSMIGHSIGSAGAISVATAALSYKHGKIPGTINLENPADGCDLDYTADGSRQIDLDHCLCNAFALGGHNACIVLGRA